MFEGGATIALVVAAATNIFAYWNSDRMVLSMHGAQEIDDYLNDRPVTGQVQSVVVAPAASTPRSAVA